MRDLGTEGAIITDVRLTRDSETWFRTADDRRGPAMVATGSYGPRLRARMDGPAGCGETAGWTTSRDLRPDRHGVDVIKVYADYRWGAGSGSRPTFTLDELRRIVEVAKSSGTPVVAHASTAEGMRRAIEAGVETIEHGDSGTAEIWKLMVEKKVGFCPTVAAGDATAHAGWKRGAARASSHRRPARQLQTARSMPASPCASQRRRRVRAQRQRARLGSWFRATCRRAQVRPRPPQTRLFHVDDRVGTVKAGLLADLSCRRRPDHRHRGAPEDQAGDEGGRICRNAGISQDNRLPKRQRKENAQGKSGRWQVGRGFGVVPSAFCNFPSRCLLYFASADGGAELIEVHQRVEHQE